MPPLHAKDQVCPLNVVGIQSMRSVVGQIHTELGPDSKGARLNGIVAPGRQASGSHFELWAAER